MAYDWFLGMDCGATAHAGCLLDANGRVVLARVVAHNAAAITAFFAEILQVTHAEASRIAVGLEVPRGAVIDALFERGFAVFAINPKQLDRCRDRYTAAGAKDDRRDAWVLADVLRTTPNAFRRAIVDDAWVVEVRELSRLAEELEADVRRLANRLREQIHRVAPALLALCPAADEPWLWSLWDRAPTAATRRRLTVSRLITLLQRHHVRRVTASELRTVLMTADFPLPAGLETAVGARIAALLPQLRAAADQRHQTHRRLKRLLAVDDEQGEHHDVRIVRSLPGVGTLVAAAVLGEASEPLRARNYHTLRTLTGAAPVTKQSGKMRLVHMRYCCNPRLRQALYHWARCSIQRDDGARAYYARLRQRGISHGAALRRLSDRWLRILIAMLRQQSVYDATRWCASAA